MDFSERGEMCTSCLDVAGAFVVEANSSPESPNMGRQSHGSKHPQDEEHGGMRVGNSLAERILQLRDALDCAAIGIRLVDDDGHLIYRAHHGFPSGFCDYVSGICVPDDQCVCVKVLHANLGPVGRCHTDRGSFVANSVFDLSASASDDPDRIAHLTGTGPCYRSIAVTPLRCMGHNLGIVHSAAGQAGHFTPERVRVLEETAQEIARDLFFDSLWRPVIGPGESLQPARAQAICPICDRRRKADDTWGTRDTAPRDLSWTVLGAPRVVCPTCLRFCNSE